MRKKNMALLLEYDGSRYDGWQRQGNTDNTIEGKLEKILERLTGACQQVHGSGRTDAGVHAAGQVANVCLDTDMSEGELRDYLNRYLPEDIKVLQVREVPERFHSRLWAKEKTYTYYIDMDEKSSVFARKYTYAVGKGLDVGAMEQAVGYLVGTHDFAGFCSNKKKKKSTVRTIKDIRFQVSKNCLSVSVTGDGFLYNMVRILVGTLIEIGLGKRTPDSVKEVLDCRDRQAAGFMAPARGLFLVSVVYETEIFPVEVEETVR
ncbi:MAG: tRNA pseudouridine(38-40) synthase TruA [Hungatella sp.]|nr:tRNA pseudouridine(38-40) synthase TruA [Hungatella sp.]